MATILLVSGECGKFKEMTDAFGRHAINVMCVQTGEAALGAIRDTSCLALVVDEHLQDMAGRALIEKIIVQNPLMNCVAVSTLSHDDFHEAYEGMGVLMQFPPVPSGKDAQNLMDHLEKIHALFKK